MGPNRWGESERSFGPGGTVMCPLLVSPLVMSKDDKRDARDDVGVRIFTPIAILPGWEPGEPIEEYYELNKRNFEEIDGSVKHPDTDVVYEQVPDGVGPYVKQHHETDLVAIPHARESYLADTEDDFDAIRLPCFDEPGSTRRANSAICWC